MHAMELAIPGMIDTLQEAFYSEEQITVGVDRDKEGNVVAEYKRPKISQKEKTAIAFGFIRTLAMRDRVEDDLGLREKKSASSDNPIVAIIGGNVAIFKALPPAKRQEILLKLSRGEKVELPQLTMENASSE